MLEIFHSLDMARNAFDAFISNYKKNTTKKYVLDVSLYCFQRN